MGKSANIYFSSTQVNLHLKENHGLHTRNLSSIPFINQIILANPSLVEPSHCNKEASCGYFIDTKKGTIIQVFPERDENKEERLDHFVNRQYVAMTKQWFDIDEDIPKKEPLVMVNNLGTNEVILLTVSRAKELAKNLEIEANELSTQKGCSDLCFIKCLESSLVEKRINEIENTENAKFLRNPILDCA